MKNPGRLLLTLTYCAVFLLATTGAEALSVEDNVLRNPAGVNELVVNITQYGVVTSDGTPTRIVVNFSIPQDDERQDVQMDVARVEDELGTSIGVIDQANPGNRFSYTVYGIVKSRANHLASLPSSYTIPNDVEVYMQPTANIQSSAAAIRSLAEDAAKDSRDDFERVAKLAMWVHDHLNYDLSYTGKNLDALSVLEQRRGVCAEYTTLFIALARSIGIPAKFVSGYSYGDRGWERHAYAEVYLGKWFPVDPLWLEIGYLDATHLKFGDHIDNLVKNNVEVTGFNVNSIQWVEDDVTLASLSYSPIEKADYDLAISSDEFLKNDYGLVTLSITPSEYIVGRLVLEPCSGDYQVLDVYDKEKKVILRPGVKEQVYWKIKINADLPSNLLFTCPLTLNSRSLALKTIDASVNTRYNQRTDNALSARLSASVIELGAEQKVYIALSNLPGQVKLGIVAGDLKEEFDASGNFQTVFSFTPKDLGDNEVVVYTSEGEVITLAYTVTSHLNLAIENFTVPAYMKIGESHNISAYVVNKGAAEESVRINMNIDGVDNFASFMLKNAYAVSLPVAFAASGLKVIKLDVIAPGLNLTETRMTEVYEEPVVYYETDYADGKGILNLDVKKSRIKNVTITIGGSEASAGEVFGEKSFAFAIAPGEYAMEITCSDIAGTPRQITETLVFREKNFLEIILAAINDIVKALSSLFAPS